MPGSVGPCPGFTGGVPRLAEKCLDCGRGSDWSTPDLAGQRRERTRFDIAARLGGTAGRGSARVASGLAGALGLAGVVHGLAG
ncbi:hypothetical protein GCM10022222_23210 [Amycolatopsis ultiminotia]|uniref:Uncharacterized protein n=1 Tax=Amycolatopsis ultiminotia TaxID=543629 RepID=A0ABP6VNV7_9PSEU